MRKMIFCLMAMMGVLTLSAQSVYENEVINNIMARTSIRQYTNEPVSKADIETMLRAGMAAPTAVNKQPWHFVAVTNKEKLAELAGRRGMIKQAGVAIVVCGNLDKAMQGKAQEYWIQDCSAATENILLAAKALGLGAVWTGNLHQRISGSLRTCHITSLVARQSSWFYRIKCVSVSFS